MSFPHLEDLFEEENVSISDRKIPFFSKLPPLNHDLDRIIFAVLQSEGPLTRVQLVRLIGAPRSTIYDSLRRLMLKGYVESFYEQRSSQGRPKTYFEAKFYPTDLKKED